MKTPAILVFVSAIVFSGFSIANAQIQAAGGGYYVAGYGTVYGSFGQASAAQSRLYNKMKSQKAAREAASGPSTISNAKKVVPPTPVIRNHGVFRADATVDTGKALADALGDTPEEKALIKQIYTATKAVYEKEAAARGWKNNIAAGLTFFTVSAMTVYQDAEEPSDEAVVNYFKAVNSALDEIPEYAKVANKDKQGFNNMLIGFSGILLAGYSEGKQTNNADTLASYKKLAGMLIEMVLKTDPDKIRIENGQIAIK
ncbi:MAG: DUF6683 family protein [Blastocatellia bacterium]